MVKRTNNNIAERSKNENPAVLNFISEPRHPYLSKSIEITPNDEIIGSLSDAYENKRARQVFEWERVRRQNSIQRAA